MKNHVEVLLIPAPCSYSTVVKTMPRRNSFSHKWVFSTKIFHSFGPTGSIIYWCHQCHSENYNILGISGLDGWCIFYFPFTVSQWILQVSSLKSLSRYKGAIFGGQLSLQPYTISFFTKDKFHIILICLYDRRNTHFVRF